VHTHINVPQTANFNASENSVGPKEKKTQISKNSNKQVHSCNAEEIHVEEIPTPASMKGDASEEENLEKVNTRNAQNPPNPLLTRVIFKDENTKSQEISHKFSTGAKIEGSLNKDAIRKGEISNVSKASKSGNVAKNCSNTKEMIGQEASSFDVEANCNMLKNQAATSSVLCDYLEDEDIIMQENSDLHVHTIQRNKIQMESLRESLPTAHTSSGSSHSSKIHIPIIMTAMLLVIALAMRVTLEALSLY
jgi:hypothetical protein